MTLTVWSMATSKNCVFIEENKCISWTLAVTANWFIGSLYSALLSLHSWDREALENRTKFCHSKLTAGEGRVLFFNTMCKCLGAGRNLPCIGTNYLDPWLPEGFFKSHNISVKLAVLGAGNFLLIRLFLLWNVYVQANAQYYPKKGDRKFPFLKFSFKASSQKFSRK